MDGVEFRLLGPVGVWDAERWLSPSGAQQRTVLAMLLLETGRPVPVARLESALWGAESPESARNALQGHISRLRRLLAPHAAVELATSACGYCLTVERNRIDLYRFRQLVREAGGEQEPERAIELLREGLALWQGAPLADVAGKWLPDVVVPALEEERLAALERRAALDLRQGRHQEVAAELTALVGENPLRERPVSLLMTALLRGDRRTEALAVFRRVRRRFAEELGIEPGDELQRLHQAILAGREDMSGTTPPAAVIAVPRHLPPDTELFTAREEELAALDRLTLPAASHSAPSTQVMAPCVITGTGGVGKTTLAVHWAHRARDRFPDGQLYVNLQGYGPTHVARPPAEAVRLFLDALQVPAEMVPATLEAQVGLYRSLLAERRMLILLDNVLDTDQARPLLFGAAEPGAPGDDVADRPRLGAHLRHTKPARQELAGVLG